MQLSLEPLRTGILTKNFIYRLNVKKNILFREIL